MSSSTHTDSSNYGYVPSLGWAIGYIVTFSAIAIILSVLALRSKHWVVYPTLVLGCLVEVMGWSARLWSHLNVLLLTPFLMQISTLIMAPVFFSAFDYIVLGIAISKLGPQYSLLRPGLYLTVFLTADVISLVLQAVGGGMASSSAATSTPSDTATNIMVGGIIFQLISMAVFVALGFDFIFRANARRSYAFRETQIAAKREKQRQRRDSEKTLAPVESDDTGTTAPSLRKPEEAVGEDVEARENLTKWWIMLGGCLLSSIAIVVRGVYRSYELSQGWTSKVVQTEKYQNYLDGLMMVIAVGTFIFFNPLFLMPKRTSWKGVH